LEDQSKFYGKIDPTNGKIDPTKGKFSIKFSNSGSYTIYVKDDRGFIIASTSHWVEGPGLKGPSGNISIVLDKEKYKIGETAKALITLSEKADNALSTMEREKVELYGLINKASHDWISIQRQSDYQWKADIPIKKSYSPNMIFSLAYVFNGHYVFQNKSIEVETPKADIAFSFAKKEYKPGEEVNIGIVTTLDGKGVESYCTISVVNEMIYVLQPEIAPDISDFFYHRRRNQVRTSSSMNFYTYDVAIPAIEENSGYSNSYHERWLKLAGRPRRQNEETLYWEPCLKTDESGRADFSFTPDSPARWRITVRAMAKEGIVGQKKEFVRSSKDYYVEWKGDTTFRHGDQSKIKVVAFNQTNYNRSSTFIAEVEEGSGLSIPDAKRVCKKQECSLHIEKPVDLLPGANYIDVDLETVQSASKSAFIRTGLKIGGNIYDKIGTEITVIPERRPITRIKPLEIKNRKTKIKLPKDAVNIRLSLFGGISDGFLEVVHRLIDSNDHPYSVEQIASRLILLGIASQHIKQPSKLENEMIDNRLNLLQMATPDATFGWRGNTAKKISIYNSLRLLCQLAYK